MFHCYNIDVPEVCLFWYYIVVVVKSTIDGRKEVNKMPEKEDKQKILDYLCECTAAYKVSK